MTVLRFAAVFNCRIDEHLAVALHAGSGQLAVVDPARLRDELMLMLAGDGILPVLMEYADVLVPLIPEVEAVVGFDQHSRWHCYDIWEHTARALAASERTDPLVRLALLFHDLGKPASFSLGSDGEGHFYGHARLGALIAKRRLGELCFDRRVVDAVVELILMHLDILYPKDAGRWMARLGSVQLQRLIKVKQGDAYAHSELAAKRRLQELEDFQAALEGID
ncbi:MAG: HD domain-containing protein [Actinomycetia bacterium]|nr:HD domain-containing protein [Actinomycetes bacterium]